MKSAAMILPVALFITVPAVAIGEPAEPCQIISAKEASFLEKCGTQLRSFSLLLSDFTKVIGRDERGRLYFACPVQELCANDPAIGGFFIAPTRWNQSKKDAQAFLELIRQVPDVAARWSSSPPVVCPIFKVLIGDMAGHAACYAAPESNGSIIVVVASDERTGIILFFYRGEQGTTELREKVLTIIPRFKIERGVGDAALLRWMR